MLNRTCIVFLWARQSELAGALEDRLYGKVKDWICKEWFFTRVAFPGKDNPMGGMEGNTYRTAVVTLVKPNFSLNLTC
ncbi:MAG: hypothetical protein SNJ68_05290 [Cyanobacteriota bacterium]